MVAENVRYDLGNDFQKIYDAVTEVGDEIVGCDILDDFDVSDLEEIDD